MKNIKFIKIIMFSILLLLCVCVPFLVHKNNVKAETNITDLTNTEWIINETLVLNENLGQNESKSFPITGTYYSFDSSFNLIELPISSITSYRYGNISTIQINCPEEISPYTFNNYYLKDKSISLTGDIRVSYTTLHSFRFYGSSDPNYEKLRTFTITGGKDVNNQELISFISTNATLVGVSTPEEPEPDPVYTISGQYQFNNEITWLYDTSELEGVLYLPFYVYNHATSSRVNYDYIVNQYDAVGDNYLMYANETASGTFSGQYAGTFTTSANVRMLAGEEIVYFYTAEVSEYVYNWLLANGQFINDPTLDPNNPDNPDSGNNPNNPNNPDFGTDTVRQIVNQVNAFLGIQILPGLSFRDILLICIALPLLIYILKVFLGG